jgi:hypothetical protein
LRRKERFREAHKKEENGSRNLVGRTGGQDLEAGMKSNQV